MAMKKIKFLSEIQAASVDGCVSNIWIGTESPLSEQQITESSTYYSIGSTPSSYSKQGEKEEIWIDSMFDIYKYSVPTGVTELTIYSTNFYHTTGGGKVTSLVIPFSADKTVACDLDKATYTLSGAIESLNWHASYNGTITLSWPTEAKVAYILINTMGAQQPPTITYNFTIGQEGDFYIQYAE